MRTVIRTLTVTLLAGGGLLGAAPALADMSRPDVEAIVGGFVTGDRVHALLIVADPTPGTITLELEGYSPADRKFHFTRVGARMFIISAGRSTYNGHFRDVSRGISGTDFTRFRIAIRSWTVDGLGGWRLVSNTFTRPAARPGPEPSPGPDSEDDSSPAAASDASNLTDTTGLISPGAGPVEAAGGAADGSPAVADRMNPSSLLPRSGAGPQTAAPAAAKPPVSAKGLATPGWATTGGWIVLFLVPVVAGGAMFAALART